MESGKCHDLVEVKAWNVEETFGKQSAEMHRKVDETRDAYFGFIFPVNQSDMLAVADALGIERRAARAIFQHGRAFSTFRAPGKRAGGITNHIVGTSLLALRGKSLDTGLAAVTDGSLPKLVLDNEDTILEIADARSSWFGRIYFPSQAFCNAIGVFGGKVSPGAFFNVAAEHGFAAHAGQRQTVRGDFGIAVWLTLLGRAP